jgi:hypothetical protein
VKHIDDLLCNASESQLRNVLAMASRSMSIAKMNALFEREKKMAARERMQEIGEDDITFAMQMGIKL